MKKIRYNKEKDALLRKVRKIGFKDVVDAIDNNQVLAVLDHPNKKQFTNQKIFVIEIGDYIYAVPFVETENEIFLKTIYPSRKYKKKYKKL